MSTGNTTGRRGRPPKQVSNDEYRDSNTNIRNSTILLRQRDEEICQLYLEGFDDAYICNTLHINRPTLLKALEKFKKQNGQVQESYAGELVDRRKTQSNRTYKEQRDEIDDDQSDYSRTEQEDNNSNDSQSDEDNEQPVHYQPKRKSVKQIRELPPIKNQSAKKVVERNVYEEYEEPKIPLSQRIELKGSRARAKNSVLDTIEPKTKLKIYTDYTWRMPMTQIAQKYGVSIFTIKKVVDECLVVLK